MYIKKKNSKTKLTKKIKKNKPQDKTKKPKPMTNNWSSLDTKVFERNGRLDMYYYSDGSAFSLNTAFTLMPLLLFQIWPGWLENTYSPSEIIHNIAQVELNQGKYT